MYLKTNTTLLLLLVGLMMLPFFSNGQDFNPYQHNYQGWDGNKIKRSAFRAFLNKFSFSVSSGYGRMYYSHDVPSDILESPEELIMLGSFSISGNQITYEGVKDWLNAPVTVQGTRTLDETNRLIRQDTISLGYRGSGGSIPIMVSLTFDIDRFRIGAGVASEFHNLKNLNPKTGDIYSYTPNFGTTTYTRWFFTMAAKAYEYKGWQYNAEIQIGKMSYGGAFNKATLQRGLYFNLGFPFEYEFSEYFWVFIKPSFEFKNFTTLIPQIENAILPGTIQHSNPAFYLSVGVRLKLPEVRRCPIKSCQTQMKHVHANHEYRGQPFYKEQNPKIGELYPKLYRDKWKNKRQLNSGY